MMEHQIIVNNSLVSDDMILIIAWQGEGLAVIVCLCIGYFCAVYANVN